MKKVFFLLAIAAATLASCDFIKDKVGGKSEEDIRKEVEAEMRQEQDAQRLADAEARAEAAEAKAAEALEAAEKATEAAEQAATKAASAANTRSTAAPVSSSYRSGTNSSNPYAWLSQRYVTASDLSGLSKSELRILRNAIYARHGYKFKSADLLQYFSQYSWYVPAYSNVEGSLSKIERSNVATILSWELGYHFVILV